MIPSYDNDNDTQQDAGDIALYAWLAVIVSVAIYVIGSAIEWICRAVLG